MPAGVYKRTEEHRKKLSLAKLGKRFVEKRVKDSKVYWIWVNMKTRCNNPNTEKFLNYGGRGITYDPRWESFKNFQEDMEASYKEGLTLDRIDVNGNYSKENCRWATQKQQQNNRRNNILITYKGETKILAQWIKELKLNEFRTRQRLNRYHWSVEDAFEYEAYGKKEIYKDKIKNLGSWAEKGNKNYEKESKEKF